MRGIKNRNRLIQDRKLKNLFKRVTSHNKHLRLCVFAVTSRHISQWSCQERLDSGGLACELKEERVEGWTTTGTTAHLSPSLTGTKTSQVQTWHSPPYQPDTMTVFALGNNSVLFLSRQRRWQMRGDDLGSDRWFLGWQGVLREVQLLLREAQARHQPAHKSPDSSSSAGLR